MPATQLFLDGFVSINDQDWNNKAVLGNGGVGVYGSGNDCGVYAIVGADTGLPASYGLKALQGNGTGAILTEGDVHHMDGKVGIGTNQPGEALEVNGAIKVGTRGNSGAEAGTIRWFPRTKKLQVFDGTAWQNLN